MVFDRRQVLEGMLGGAVSLLTNSSTPLISPALHDKSHLVKKAQESVLVPLLPNGDDIWAFGSSTMAYLGPYLSRELSNVNFHSEGKGGERIEHTLARLGSHQAMLAVEGNLIPAQGSVQCRSYNVPPSALLKPFLVRLSGVLGEVSSTNSEFLFTRSNAGNPRRTLDLEAAVPVRSHLARDSVLILNLGKNNLRDNGNPAVKIYSMLNEVFHWLGPLVKGMIVVNHFVNTNEKPGSRQYGNVQKINKLIHLRFGRFAFDLNAYILSSKIWVDSEIIPSALDLEQQLNGIKAQGLSSDDSHLNSRANFAIAREIRRHAERFRFY